MRIGFDIGFNSKNSFIRAFKESTKLTPSEYRNQNKS
ncbi:MAG: helix-turn-helix domain-containing protein [Leptospira bouyouniensis]